MKYYCEFQRRLIFIIFLNILVHVSAVVLSNLSYAQENLDLHQKTLHEITKHTQNQYPSISVGKYPSAIAFNFFTHMVYVANPGDNTVSVISGENNTEIGRIKVGGHPSDLGVEPNTNTVYVANDGDNTVSVISGENNTEIGRIKVGFPPGDIGVDVVTNRVYVTNHGDDLVSVISGENNTEIGRIKVGDQPSAIGVDYITDREYKAKFRVYVANYGDNTVSVISGENNTEIGRIKVGYQPDAIQVDDVTYMVYVANPGDNTVSVISGENNTEIGRIKVGFPPGDIGVDHNTHIVYVANYANDSVSVISGENNTEIGRIKVGGLPSAIEVDDVTGSVYVANFLDDTVSLIDENASKVVAKVTFSTEPFNSGHIECDKEIVPIKQEFYLWSGSDCKAKPSQGFEFVSWQENLVGNSSQLLQLSSTSSVSDSILDFFHMKPDKPEATLNITKFGSFTANFKELPPPVPSEYLLGLFTIVASTIVGWSIPSIISWANSKKQTKVVFGYHQRISSLGTIDQDDITELETLNTDMGNDYSKRKISDKQYENMKNEISALYEEIFRKRIESSEGNGIPLDKLKDEIKVAYSKGKLSDQHYKLLVEEITDRTNK